MRIVKELGKGNLWDFPKQQALQKGRVLFETEMLQDFNTTYTILALALPNLWCHFSKLQAF